MRKKKTDSVKELKTDSTTDKNTSKTEPKIEKIASTKKYEAYKLTLTMQDFQDIISEKIKSMPDKELVYDTDITVGDFKLLLSPFDGTADSMIRAERVAAVIEQALRTAEQVAEQVEILRAKDELKGGRTVH